MMPHNTSSKAADPSSPASPVRDDRILPLTRWVAALLIPPLVTAFIVLYLFPSADGRSFAFAWPIRPQMTGIVMGSGYLGGAYFFARVVAARRWHHVTRGFLPVTTFATLMLLATARHWDRFDRSGPAFAVWLGLYIIAPILVPYLWLQNRRRDPGEAASDELLVPRGMRWVVGMLGACLVLLAAVLLIWPALAIGAWPWTLTPLTTRIIASWLSLPGVGALVIAQEPRWSSWRVMIESIGLWLALLTLGMLRSWNDFNQSRRLIWLAGGIPLAVVGLVILYVGMEGLRHRRALQAV